MKISALLIKRLKEQALKGQTEAYAPYSQFHVGAAILTEKGQIFSGCNIENASYGGTVCAERVAIWKAVSTGDHSPIAAVYVVTDANEAWAPCGMCRQVLIEFAKPSAVVICAGKSGKTKKYQLKDLLPHSFGPASLR